MPYKDPEARRAYQAAWYSANKEKRRAQKAAYKAAWAAANKEKVRAYKAAWDAANKEKNRAKKAAYHAAYRAANPEKARLWGTRKELKLRGFDPALAPAYRQIIDTRHQLKTLKHLINTLEEITQ